MPPYSLKILFRFANLLMIIWFLLSLILFGFSVTDLDTGSILLRCNSIGDLYPFHSTHGVSSSSSTSSAFSTISSSIWQYRLGHPGKAILDSLYSSSLIQCNENPLFSCHSCPLGKNVSLPFTNSLSFSSSNTPGSWRVDAATGSGTSAASVAT